jgi:hypothetical protein
VTVEYTIDEVSRSLRYAFREAVAAKTDNNCYYCGVAFHSGNHMTVDHVIPLAAGGPDNLDNCVPCCRACNNTKGNLSLDRFREVNKWRLSNMPDFTHEQVEWMKHNFKVDVTEWLDPRFWYEREQQHDSGL